MADLFLKSLRASGYSLAVVMAIAPLAAQVSPAAAKAKTAPKTAWTQGRTPDGQPDIQGIWSNATTTPLERPSTVAGKQVLTDEETAELEKQTEENRNTDKR